MALDLHALREALAQAQTLPELSAAASALGLGVAEQQVFGSQPYHYVTLSFSAPIPAGTLCTAMAWTRPYAVSGDVSQRRWHIRLWASDLADPYGPRIHTVLPTIGVWSISAWLTDRPAGELPGVAAGASPAYDLTTYPAEVAALELRHADAAS